MRKDKVEIMKDSKQVIDKLIGKNAKIVLEIIEKNKKKKNKGDSNDK